MVSAEDFSLSGSMTGNGLPYFQRNSLSWGGSSLVWEIVLTLILCTFSCLATSVEITNRQDF